MKRNKFSFIPLFRMTFIPYLLMCSCVTTSGVVGKWTEIGEI